MENIFEKIMKKSDDPDRKENVILGIVGAVLFSLAGGLMWMGLYYAGFFAGISGLAGVVASIYGYIIFGGKISKKGIIIAVIAAFLSLVLGWYMCLTIDIHDAFNSWYEEGEVVRVPSVFECFTLGPDFLADPDVAGAYFKDLALGLFLAIIGAGGFVVRSFKKTNVAKAPQNEAPQQISALDEFDYDENGMPKRVENDGGEENATDERKE